MANDIATHILSSLYSHDPLFPVKAIFDKIKCRVREQSVVAMAPYINDLLDNLLRAEKKDNTDDAA